jgi:AraC-like DNA-binding protein/quercetin dioxygenase-like cupin family protein
MQITYEKLVVDETSLFHSQEFIQPRFTSSFHMHDEFELIAIINSHGKLYLGNNVVNFNKGDLFLIAPGLPHCFYNTNGYEKGESMAHAFVVMFRKDFLGKDFFEKTETSRLNRLIKKAESGVRILNPSGTLINRMLMLRTRKNLEKLSDLLLILNELAGKKSNVLSNSIDRINVSGLSESKIINDVFKYVAENFQDTITLARAASIANMQKAAFCRYFKRKTKKKFSEFVNDIRITHARKLLTETDKTVKEVAYECGFESNSYFNRQFKSTCKMSPSELRSQIKYA